MYNYIEISVREAGQTMLAKVRSKYVGKKFDYNGEFSRESQNSKPYLKSQLRKIKLVI
jgi:hypothetical protein